MFLWIYSCNYFSSSKGPDEGSIVFDITYLDDERENPLISLLPTQMTLKFKNNNTISFIEGFFGVFKLSYITNNEMGKNFTLLRLMDKKYIYESDTTGPLFGYEKMKNIEVRKSTKKKIIAGYECFEGEMKCPQISDSVIKFYYTYGIDIENPNVCNPFKKIDGVLLEFQVNLNNINMRFVAKNVKIEEVSESEFEIPKGYKTITIQEMQKIMESFNQSTKD